jgi:hypothetical protein
MSIINEWINSQKSITPYFKIRCPRNKIVKPGLYPYKIKENKFLRNFTQANIDYINRVFGTKLVKYQYERDQWGRKIKDERSFYSPLVSPAYLLEHVYDPDNYVCKAVCRHQCVHKIGGFNNIGIIKRLK